MQCAKERGGEIEIEGWRGRERGREKRTDRHNTTSQRGVCVTSDFDAAAVSVAPRKVDYACVCVWAQSVCLCGVYVCVCTFH